MSQDPFDAAVTNLRETTKWLIASIGAMFVTVLAGVQFNRVPLLSDTTAMFAGIAAAGGVMIAFGLAIATLTGGTVAFPDLVAKKRFKAARRYINENWGGSPDSDQIERIGRAIADKDEKVRAKTLSASDPDYVAINARATELQRIARWYVVRARFWWLCL